MPFNLIEKVNTFIDNSKRVYRLAKRPTFKEARLILRVSGLGVVILGFVGYVIKLLFLILSFLFRGSYTIGS
ncbi:MAG: protein translocase SEC61 complex subunit gamma [Candidatus Helarchaeota archaeon]